MSGGGGGRGGGAAALGGVGFAAGVALAVLADRRMRRGRAITFRITAIGPET